MNALQRGLSDGVDVMTMSFNLWWCGNSVPYGCAPLYDALRNVTNGGMLWVGAIGNRTAADVGTCNAGYPAVRRDGLAVAALDTADVTSISGYDSAGLSNLSALTQVSARGGMTIRTVDGVNRANAFAIADLAAPGAYNWMYSGSPNQYSGDFTLFRGTSLAAPSVAAAAGLLRETLNAYGHDGNNARLLLVNMLMLGDGFHSDAGHSNTQTGFDQRSGAGRLHMHYPHAANLTAPWEWGAGGFTISGGEIIRIVVGPDAGAEHPAVTQLKVAMTWDEHDYNGVADIVLRVTDNCSGTPTEVVTDWSFDIRKRIDLSQSQITGRCLAIEIAGYDIPWLQTRTVWLAHYYHGGSPADH